MSGLDRANAEREQRKKEIYIIFDGLPGPESPRFVEVENGEGRSIRIEWSKYGEFYRLGPFQLENEVSG